MKLLYQFCVAFKKVEGPYSKRVLREQLTDFIQDDIDLGYLDFSTESRRELARDAKAIITKVLHSLDPFDPGQAERFVPRPGPGATNTPCEKHMRYRPHVWYPNLAIFDPDEWFRPPSIKGRGGWHIQYYPGMPVGYVRRRKRPRPLKYKVAAHGARARYESVPKTYAKPRGICIEENEVQWLQQALRRALYERIERHPETKGRVNFTSQELNGRLALDGSLDKEWVTIDLSSASDLVFRCLVAYLFGGNKPMLDAILAVSSTEIELPVDVPGLPVRGFLPINKIAPMGSAICFPIMALVIYSLIRAILNSSQVPQADKRKVYVYGDDIIVSRACAQAVYDWLPEFGFRINQTKSFRFSHFRESCGVHAYRGVDITPTRIKRIPNRSSRAATIESALRLEESFYKKGYSSTADCLRNLLQKPLAQHGMKQLPTVSGESAVIGWYRSGDAKYCEFAKHAKKSLVGSFLAHMGV
jgi:hypothetical protein